MLLSQIQITRRSFLWIFFLLSLVSWKSEDINPKADNIFDQIRTVFDLMEFIANAEFVDGYQQAHEPLINDLRSEGIALLPLPDGSQAATQSGDTTSAPTQALHFASEDKTYQLDIIQHADKAYLFNYWKQSLNTLGLKVDIRNDFGGSVFLKVKTKEHSAVGALFYTGRNVVGITIYLPFPVPNTYDELKTSEKTIINNKYEELYLILEHIAKHYVHPSEFIYCPPHNKSLTIAQRLFGFIQFWTEVKYNFAFFDQVPDLNWDHVLADYLPLIEKEQSNEEYYNTLKKVCALLKDGHTNIFPPPALESSYDTPSLQLINLQNKAIVENVAVTLKDKIPIGSEIVSVDGVSTGMYLATEIFPYISSSTEYILWDWGIRDMLKGKCGTAVDLKIVTPDGQEKQLSLIRDKKSNPTDWVKENKSWKLFEFKCIQDDVAYVALNSFGNNKIIEEFRNHIDTINTCKGLILDLRENGGGNSSHGYEIIKHLTDKPFLTSKWRTREHRAAFKAWGKFQVSDYRSMRQNQDLNEWEKSMMDYYHGDKWYVEEADTIVPPENKKITLPLVVLIGHNTASAAEDFLIALDNLKMATVIGERTFGSTGQPLMIDLPGGGSARICTKRDEYPDGRQFVGIGIEPDIYVENTLEDFLNGNDATLNKGIEIIKKSKDKI